MARLRVALERQWDSRRGTLTLTSTRTDVPEQHPFSITVAAKTEERAADLWDQWQRIYQQMGCEVRIK